MGAAKKEGLLDKLELAFVKSTVDGHGGRIEVASTVGQGSIFTVRLPQKVGEQNL